MEISAEVKNLSFVNLNHPLYPGDINYIAIVLEKIASVQQKINEVSFPEFSYIVLDCSPKKVFLVQQPLKVG